MEMLMLMCVAMVMTHLCSISVGGVSNGETRQKPHILLIVADDLGWNDVSWHNPDVVTPNLEELALGGVILNRSYVLPICTPTRSALMTGRYPFTTGRQRSTIRPSEPVGLTLNATLLPQVLKDAGYTTHAVGKWHLGYCSWSYTPTYRGFDTFYGYYNGAEDYFTHTRSNLKQEYYDDTGDVIDQAEKTADYWLDLRNNTEPDTTKNGIYSAHLFASYVEDLLESRNPADPMFLYLPFQNVHAPLMVPSNYTGPYQHIHDIDRRTYLGMVTALDEAVGRVVDALKTTGHYNNSVIVFTTDNGGTCHHGGNNWPLRGMKATLWEGGTRGVAFVHSPLLPNPGTVSNKLLHAIDWFKTLVGLGEGVAPSATDGFDQWSAITGTGPSPRKKMVYNIDKTEKLRASVRIGHYKLIVGNPGEGHWTPPPEVTADGEQNEGKPLADEALSWSLFPKGSDLFDPETDSFQNEIWADILHGGSRVSPLDPSASSQVKENIHQFTTETQNPTRHLKPFSSKMPLKEPNPGEYQGHLLASEVILLKDNSIPMDSVENIITWNDLIANSLVSEEAWIDRFPDLLDLLKNKTEIRLYNVKDDPEERTNLADSKIHKVKVLLEFLLDEIMNRYVPADVKEEVPDANPKYWNNVWSPGWCTPT